MIDYPHLVGPRIHSPRRPLILLLLHGRPLRLLGQARARLERAPAERHVVEEHGALVLAHVGHDAGAVVGEEGADELVREGSAAAVGHGGDEGVQLDQAAFFGVELPVGLNYLNDGCPLILGFCGLRFNAGPRLGQGSA